MPDLVGRLDYGIYGGTKKVLKFHKRVSCALSTHPEFSRNENNVWNLLEVFDEKPCRKRATHLGARIPKTKLDKNAMQGVGGLPNVSNC
jgi:hypothetical protein